MVLEIAPARWETWERDEETWRGSKGWIQSCSVLTGLFNFPKKEVMVDALHLQRPEKVRKVKSH